MRSRLCADYSCLVGVERCWALFVRFVLIFWPTFVVAIDTTLSQHQHAFHFLFSCSTWMIVRSRGYQLCQIPHIISPSFCSSFWTPPKIFFPPNANQTTAVTSLKHNPPEAKPHQIQAKIKPKLSPKISFGKFFDLAAPTDTPISGPLLFLSFFPMLLPLLLPHTRLHRRQKQVLAQRHLHHLFLPEHLLGQTNRDFRSGTICWQEQKVSDPSYQNRYDGFLRLVESPSPLPSHDTYITPAENTIFFTKPSLIRRI